VAALDDSIWSVRAAAAKAFIELARAALRPAPGARSAPAPVASGAAPGPLSESAVEALIRALEDPEPAVRAAAVEALGATGLARHAPAIAALARAPEVPPILVLAALRALVALGRPPADVVSRAATHSDPEVVKEAVAAAARLPGPEGEALLRQAAENARWDVRQAAARAMVERGDPALRPAAEALALREADPLVARAFAEAARALSGR
jgi:HEAT repeat protein